MTPESYQRISRDHGKTVLLLTDRRRSVLKRQLTKTGYLVAETFTPDQAVAICANSPVDAVVIDQSFFVEKFTDDLPQGVDAMTAGENPTELLACLERLFHQSEGATQTAHTSAKGEIVRSKHRVSLEEWCEGVDSPE